MIFFLFQLYYIIAILINGYKLIILQAVLVMIFAVSDTQ